MKAIKRCIKAIGQFLESKWWVRRRYWHFSHGFLIYIHYLILCHISSFCSVVKYKIDIYCFDNYDFHPNLFFFASMRQCGKSVSRNLLYYFDDDFHGTKIDEFTCAKMRRCDAWSLRTHFNLHEDHSHMIAVGAFGLIWNWNIIRTHHNERCWGKNCMYGIKWSSSVVFLCCFLYSGNNTQPNEWARE